MPAIKGFYVNGITYNYQDSNLAPEWDTNTDYKEGDIIYFYDSLFKCLIANKGKQPILNPIHWEQGPLSELLGFKETETETTQANTVASFDFSTLGSGYFTVTWEGNTTSYYLITKDQQNRITAITDTADGHTTEVIWE